MSDKSDRHKVIEDELQHRILGDLDTVIERLTELRDTYKDQGFCQLTLESYTACGNTFYLRLVGVKLS